jgi:hypothetical protein
MENNGSKFLIKIIMFILGACIFSYISNVIINSIQLGKTVEIVKSIDPKETSISKSDVKIIGLSRVAYINMLPSVVGAIINSIMVYFILKS